jgi:hypothetical protein
MLHPEERHSLTEALRPPAGWKLDQALGTTYTLDLMALLTVPLSFTFFDIEDSDGKPIADPIRVMEAMRRYAHRVHVFCQFGRISFSKPNRLLNVFVEKAVHGVKAPRGGVFHPKVWALRFVDANESVMYRLLVSSRNLTFDRSWDTILCFEGPVEDRKNAFAINHPLGDFIDALPGMCINTPNAGTRKVVKQFQHELRRTRFECPEGLTLTGFHPLGFEGEKTVALMGSATELSVISPFVTDDLLRDIVIGKQRSTLLSRRESLDQLDETVLSAYTAVYIMDQTVETEMESEESGEEKPEEQLVGLHAKCFVVERGNRATIYTGSANATNAAFSRNVEMLVALEGARGKFGSSAIFGNAKEPSDFLKLLRPYARSERPPDIDGSEVEFEALRDAVIDSLADTSLRADCEQVKDTLFILTLHGKMTLQRMRTSDATLHVYPLSLGEQFAQPVDASKPLHVVFHGLSFEAISSFFVFDLQWQSQERKFRHRFVLNVPLSGAPEDRTARVMGLLLKDQRQVMRLLMMILGLIDPTEMARQGGGPYIDTGWRQLIAGNDSRPLFELLVRAASRHPERIEEIDRIVVYLRKAENGNALLPVGFDDIWLPVREATRNRKRK